MGLLDGTMAAIYDLSAEIDRYSELRDKLKADKISVAERKELRSMRRYLAV